MRAGIRLEAAAAMIPVSGTVADIACDHGKLGVLLLESGTARRVIDTDISLPSLEKARRLSAGRKLLDRTEFRAGDGMSVLAPYEADTVALLGIGGTLMKRILENCPVPMMGASCMVLSPMSSQEDIRQWLYESGYRIDRDRVVEESGRFYPVIRVRPPQKDCEPLPAWWPEGCFYTGYRAALTPDPVFIRFLESRIRMLSGRVRQGAPSMRELSDLMTIANHLELKDEARKVYRNDGEGGPEVDGGGMGQSRPSDRACIG